MLSEDLLLLRLSERNALIPVTLTEETGSTNDDAKAFAAREHPDGPALFVSCRQTGGRGRQGRSFLSAPGGLYMSLLLPTGLPLTRTVGATGCAAVAACRAVEETAGVPARIKWVNDILTPDARTGKTGKAAGILCESIGEDGFSRCLVIGIGVNVTCAPALDGSGLPASALSSPEHPAEREALCASLTAGFLSMAAGGFDFSACADEYRRRSAVLGQEVSFLKNGVSRTGLAFAIRDDGALLVETPDGTAALDSGEITVRFR